MPANATPLPKAPIVAIVDDDADVREALSDLLLVQDITCRTFARAEAFMAEYVPGRFDCLVTDVSMPGRSGLELQERLRHLGSSMPVIIITADTSPITRSRALRGGARAVLTKPVNDEVLLYHLQCSLNHSGFMRDDDGQDTPADD